MKERDKAGRLQTIAVHAGAQPDAATGAVAPPIHLSTTFEHGPESEKLHGFMYVRESNPTQDRLEEALAGLEGGAAALAFASGMAAGTALIQALPPGAHVVFPDDMYSGFKELAKDFLSNWGIESSVVDMQDIENVRRSLRPSTKLVWLETPSNPLLKVVDVRAMADCAHRAGAAVVVDNTFATPALQRPIELGADIVLHSTTKYLGGHSDVQGGALIFQRKSGFSDRVGHVRHICGAVASPFNSWLVLRGIRTLFCRMATHSENASFIAARLARHKRVDAVHYPGLRSHPGHAVARRQMKAFGGMLSFQVRGSRKEAVRVASRLKIFTNATSLGGVESLIEHRASSESSSGYRSTTAENLLRVSVGLEDRNDLWADLEQAL